MADENLSALLDGECSAEELDRVLARMERSPELKRSFSRLCLTREASAGTRILQTCICDDVMSRLDPEPLPLSPRVADLDERRRAPRRWAWEPAAGLAAAAALGALAVLVTLPQERQGAAVAASGGSAFMAQATATPVALPVPTVSRPRHLQQVAAQVEGEDDLSNYLIEHSNTAAGRGMGGTLSYARFAAHNAVYRPQSEEQR